VEITREELERRIAEYKQSGDKFMADATANFGAMQAMQKLLDDLLKKDADDGPIYDLASIIQPEE